MALSDEGGVGLIGGGLIGLVGDDSVFDGVVLVEAVVLGEGNWFEDVKIGCGGGVWSGDSFVGGFWLFGFGFPFDDE